MLLAKYDDTMATEIQVPQLFRNLR